MLFSSAQDKATVHREDGPSETSSVKTKLIGRKSRKEPPKPANWRFSGKTFEQIKAELQPGELFVDKEFDAVDTNVFYSGNYPKEPCNPPYQWRRPKEICKNPGMFVDGVDRFDIVQGATGDCWFLAALASVAQQPKLLKKIIPPYQDFKTGYAGIFRFNFWRDGKWIEMIIDDRLPTKTYEGEIILPMTHSEKKNEFWTALLEKAYAKFYDSYEGIEGGLPAEAMVDFTGGVVETFIVGPTTSLTFFSTLSRAFKLGSLIGCGTRPNARGISKTTNIVPSHAYSMTDLQTIEDNLNLKFFCSEYAIHGDK